MAVQPEKWDPVRDAIPQVAAVATVVVLEVAAAVGWFGKAGDVCTSDGWAWGWCRTKREARGAPIRWRDGGRWREEGGHGGGAPR